MVADGIQNHSPAAVTVQATNALRSRKPRTFLVHQHYAQGHFLYLYIQQYGCYYYCSLITALCWKYNNFQTKESTSCKCR